MTFEFGDLDFGVENPSSLKVPYLKIIKPTSQEAGTWAGSSQIRPGEFASSGNPELHGYAIEFFPVVGFGTDQRGNPLPGGRRYTHPVEYSKTLCRSYDNVRPVTDHSVGNREPFYDARTQTNVIIDFTYKPNERRLHDDGLHVGGCQACPLGQWNDRQPPPCKPAALLPIYVARALVFDPNSGLTGDPLAFFREQHEKGAQMVYDDSLMVESFDFEDWNEYMVWSLEKFSLDSVVTGKFTAVQEKPAVPHINSFIQRYIHTVPAANPVVDELLTAMSGGPEAMLVFQNEAGELFDIEGALAYESDDLSFYGLRSIRAYTLQFANRDPNRQPHITPKLMPGTYVMAKGTEEYDNYLERRRMAARMSVPELLGWRTTEDFLSYTEDALPAPPSLQALPAPEDKGGITPPKAATSAHDVGDYSYTDLLDED